jgi:hypothetical protein
MRQIRFVMQIQGFLNWNWLGKVTPVSPNRCLLTVTMHLMYTLDEAGNRAYTLKVSHTILFFLYMLT